MRMEALTNASMILIVLQALTAVATCAWPVSMMDSTALTVTTASATQAIVLVTMFVKLPGLPVMTVLATLSSAATTPSVKLPIHSTGAASRAPLEGPVEPTNSVSPEFAPITSVATPVVLFQEQTATRTLSVRQATAFSL